MFSTSMTTMVDKAGAVDALLLTGRDVLLAALVDVEAALIVVSSSLLSASATLFTGRVGILGIFLPLLPFFLANRAVLPTILDEVVDVDVSQLIDEVSIVLGLHEPNADANSRCENDKPTRRRETTIGDATLFFVSRI